MAGLIARLSDDAEEFGDKIGQTADRYLRGPEPTTPARAFVNSVNPYEAARQTVSYNTRQIPGPQIPVVGVDYAQRMATDEEDAPTLSSTLGMRAASHMRRRF